jgi:arabinose-5-phosphate isomerase
MSKAVTGTRVLETAASCLNHESRAVANLASHLKKSFILAVDLLMNCQGRAVVIGIGKSGHVGAKIAATLASTGTPAFFLHPAEAAHGDLGMIKKDDLAIILSHSGESEEIVRILPVLSANCGGIITITGNPISSLAKASSVVLETGVQEEADPRGLAPTSSAIAALALGDALAIATSVERGFTADQFLRLHPGGSLGKLARPD